MSLLSKLTLVIPTFNRPRYALRNMRYWSGSSVTVHVLDGSELAIPAEEMVELAANVNYHHLPISLFDRLKKILDLIQTEYAAMLGDDEFFLPKGLQACIQELEADETLVSCMGRCLAFRPISKQLIGWPAYTEMVGYAVLQDDPVARMIHHMNPYTCSTIYSVVRTPVWKQAMGIACKKQFSVFALGEIQFELSVCYRGKSKVIPHLMWLRSAENDGIRDEHDVVLFREWWIDPKKANDREEFLTLMASALAHGDIRRLESVREGVKAACNEHYKFLVMDGYLRGFRAFVAKVANLLPPAVKAAVRAPIIRLLVALPGGDVYARLRNKSLLQAARELEATGVRVNCEQLSQIADRIREFHCLPLDQAMGPLSQCGIDS